MMIPKEVLFLMEALERGGYEAYLVGGCVRDRQMGIAPHDYDITTSASPLQMKAVFEGMRVIETGIAHGTLTVLTSLGGVEITTYRQDGVYSDHRHPDKVTFTASLEEDLARRDFTINAMAMDRFGAMADPFGGRSDLEKGIIRCVGNAAQRFEEDALRILRALRFAARFGFTIEEETAAAMEEKKPLLAYVAKERIFSEFCGFLCAPHFKSLWEKHQGVLEEVLPEFSKEQRFKAVSLASALENKLSLRLSALFCFMDGEAFLRRYRASNALKKEVGGIMDASKTFCPPLEEAVHSALLKHSPSVFLDGIALRAKKEGDCQLEFYQACVKNLLEKEACLSLSDLKIGGRELMDLGFEGKRIGEILEALLLMVAKKEAANEKEELLEKAKKWM